MSGNYISQIERGERPASDAALIALADLYGVDQKQVFGLYGKLPNEEVNMIMQMPELRSVFILGMLFIAFLSSFFIIRLHSVKDFGKSKVKMLG